jgi:hypothetical protein
MSYLSSIPVLTIIKDIKGCRSIYKAMHLSEQYPNSLQKWMNEISDKIDPNFFRTTQYMILHINLRKIQN